MNLCNNTDVPPGILHDTFRRRQPLEELLYPFSRFINQGEIIAPYGFARCALHIILFYFLKNSE